MPVQKVSYTRTGEKMNAHPNNCHQSQKSDENRFAKLWLLFFFPVIYSNEFLVLSLFVRFANWGPVFTLLGEEKSVVLFFPGINIEYRVCFRRNSRNAREMNE